MVVVMLTVFASSAMARHNAGEQKWHQCYAPMMGKLFLFQKCDENGCPEEGNGPWPILQTGRWGQMQYNLLGNKFRFSFEGKKLVPDTDYTLIYYPDPWPGNNLICLGTAKSNRAGNLQIRGEKEILVDDGSGVLVKSGLPASYDANYNAAESSGAVGAKIWLVRSDDVQCVEVDSMMINWTPQDYLFEGNLIVYQYSEERPLKFEKK
jgi:hypothetical protein